MEELTSETGVTRSRSLAVVTVAIVFALLAIVATALVFYWLWSWTGRLDAEAGRREFTPQLMQRKSSAMLEIHDGLAAGKLDRVKQGAALLRQISETAKWYLPDNRYAALSDEFRDALDAFEEGISDRDLAQLRSAHDRLAESCLECHRKAATNRIEPESIQFFNPEDPPGMTDM